MSAETFRYLSVDDYARQQGVQSEDVILMINRGLKLGRLIDNQWYVEVPEVKSDKETNRDIYGPTNPVTAYLQAAAILDNARVCDFFDKRNQAPLKADAPELGVDMPLVKKTAEIWDARLLIKDVLITTIAIIMGIWIANIIDDEYRYALDEQIYVTDISVALLALISIAAITFGYTVWGKRNARLALHGDRILEQTTPKECMPTENLVVYGGFIPFIGSGMELNGWSFTVDMSTPLNPNEPIVPVSSAELYSETFTTLQKLGIQDLQLGDRIFVDGRDSVHVPIVQPDGIFSKPRNNLDTAELDLFVGQNHSRIRHYKLARAYLWSGQLVLSNYFRYVMRSGILYTEVKMHLVLPLHEYYTETINPDHFFTLRDLAKDLIGSVLKSPISWIPSVIHVYKTLIQGFRELFSSPLRKNIKDIKRAVRYCYGWPTSFRELMSTPNYERYFQKMDKDFHVKMITEALLESLRDSLEKRNIATDFLKEASTTIFNEGIIVSGGKVSAESIAAGRGAKSLAKRFSVKKRDHQPQQ